MLARWEQVNAKNRCEGRGEGLGSASFRHPWPAMARRGRAAAAQATAAEGSKPNVRFALVIMGFVLAGTLSVLFSRSLATRSNSK